MIRVLQVVGTADRGGAETMIMNLYRKIDRNKIQFDFTNHSSRKAAYDDEIESLGGRIIYLPKLKGYNYFQYAKAWKDLFKNHPEYKIVHIHNYNIAGIVAGIARKCGIDVIITHSHSTRLNMSWFKKRVFYLFYKSMIKNSTHRFSCGENAGEFLFGKRSFTVLPNAIDVTKFKFDKGSRKKLRGELGISENVKIYGHVGSFREPKNHLFLIDIYEQIKKVEPESKLVLVGQGDLIELVKERVQLRGLEGNVLFMGQRANVNEWLSAFDVFLLPSLWEGLPVSVVEAQCAGLPCVISDVIDRSVDLTGSVKFISLNRSAEEWAREIVESKVADREEMGQVVENSNYNIDKAINFISDFYLNSISEFNCKYKG